MCETCGKVLVREVRPGHLVLIGEVLDSAVEFGGHISFTVPRYTDVPGDAEARELYYWLRDFVASHESRRRLLTEDHDALAHYVAWATGVRLREQAKQLLDRSAGPTCWIGGRRQDFERAWAAAQSHPEIFGRVPDAGTLLS